MAVKDRNGRTVSVTFIIYDYQYDSPNWTYSLINPNDETLHNGGRRYVESALELSFS